jgi:hypothetical protein
MVTRMEEERQWVATARPMPEAPPVIRAWEWGRKTDILSGCVGLFVRGDWWDWWDGKMGELGWDVLRVCV